MHRCSERTKALHETSAQEQLWRNAQWYNSNDDDITDIASLTLNISTGREMSLTGRRQCRNSATLVKTNITVNQQKNQRTVDCISEKLCNFPLSATLFAILRNS